MAFAANGRHPLARSEDLVVEELGDELLVYDMNVDHVHCLTATAARVWRACDGKTTSAELAGTLGMSGGEVEAALDELERFELLESFSGANGSMSRRDFGLRVTKVAAVTASVPLIVSIAAPVAAHAVTPSACFKLPFKGDCGICNQGGTPTPCCCCHGGGKSSKPIGCAIDPDECCFSGLFSEPSHCTEEGGTKVDC